MRVSHTLPFEQIDTTIRMMPVGSYGIGRDGRYYFRAPHHAACLDDPGMSVDMSIPGGVEFVRLLPRGTKITIEVE